MPYIEYIKRAQFDCYLNLLTKNIEDEGQLNYVLTKLIHLTLEKWGLKYKFLCRICGVLSNVKDEFYRTIIIPYEDKKKLENGHISKLDAAN